MRGWGFKDPYYYCVIEIQNKDGMTIDVGTSSIIIDDKLYTGLVSNKVLSGKTRTTSGIHTVQVHKNNWLAVQPGYTTLNDLKAEDYLYPYNHKLLIEGYQYGNLYPSTSEKIYLGVNLFAEYLANRISIFDFVGNAAHNDYSIFALDKDIANS